MALANLFSALDYIILTVTIIIPILVGIYYGIVNKKTTDDLFTGGRNLKIWPVAASLMATGTSAITVLGHPAEVYLFGIQIFVVALLLIVFVPICVYIFVPFFYPMKLTSIYEYLEGRFQSPAVRMFASFTFLFQQLVFASIILYAPSIALKRFVGLSPLVSIIGIGVAGTVYTSIGGLKAVVFTDAFQCVLIYAGVLAILIKSMMVAGGVGRAFEVAWEGGRLQLIDFSVDPFMRHNFLNIILGFAVVQLTQAGTRQHEVQRYSSMPTLASAKKSVLLYIPLSIIIQALSLCIGVALYAIHKGCDPILLGEIQKADELVPLFVVKEFSGVPGMVGLFTSCMFCAVLSSISSFINGMVAITWMDFLSKLSYFEKLEESRKATVSIFIGVIYGIISITLAFFAEYVGPVYQASYAVTGPSAGVLSAIFVMALFMPFINKYGALGGMIIGLGTTVYISLQAYVRNIKNEQLELDTNNCPAGINGTLFQSNTFFEKTNTEWPEKFYTLSYVLYPTLAAFLTISSGIIISLVVRDILKVNIVVDRKYLHPFLRSKAERGNPRDDLHLEMTANS